MGLTFIAVSWVVFAYFLAPFVIAKAYRGESLTIINHLFRGQADRPVTAYIIRWSHLVSKVSLGLVVLNVYIILAVVGLTRKAPTVPSESMGKAVISKPRRWLVYGLGAVILCGPFSDLVRGTEHWPFSAFPMFSHLLLSRTSTTLRLYGVVQRSPLIEIQLNSNLHLEPFDHSRLAGAFMSMQEDRYKEAVTDCLTRYESLRRAGIHQGPPLVGMRLYRVTWTLDPSVNNLDHPDGKDLISEVVSPPQGGD